MLITGVCRGPCDQGGRVRFAQSDGAFWYDFFWSLIVSIFFLSLSFFCLLFFCLLSVTIADVSCVRDHEALTFREFIFILFLLGIITDVSVIRDNEEMASKAIQDMNRRELPSVCPPHGRLILKKAEKSRQQKEWEKVLLLKTSRYS